MKNIIFLLPLFLFNVSMLSAQDDIENEGNNQTIYMANNAIYSFKQNKVTIKYINGEFVTTDTKGTPFLFKKMRPGKVFLHGKKIEYNQINYDAIGDNFLVFSKEAMQKYKSDLPLLKINSDDIKYVSISDKKRTRFFAHIYPSKFAVTPKTEFFEIFTPDISKIYLAVSLQKERIKKNLRPGLGNETTDLKYRFAKKTTYYIKTKNGLYHETKLGKKQILKTLNDKANENKLKKYIKKHRLRLNYNLYHVQKLLTYYFEELLNK